MNATFEKKLALLSALATVTASTLALKPPVTSIDPTSNGNLGAAQQIVLGAFQHVGAAQQVDGYLLWGTRHQQGF